MEQTMEENTCTTYNSIMEDYIKVAFPILERLKEHIRDCAICQQYLLENRDAFALFMIGMSDDEFREKLKT